MSEAEAGTGSLSDDLNKAESTLKLKLKLLLKGEIMWERMRAGSGLLKIRPQEEADLDPALVDRMTAHAKRLLSEGNLHSDTDVTIAVDELQPNTTEIVDAFIVVVSHIAHSFGPNNLLAVIRIREWADRNRGPVMVSC